MRYIPRLFVLCLLVLLGTVTTATPWQPHGEVLRRAEKDTTTTAAESATTGAAATTAATASKTDSKTDTASATDSTGTGTGTGTTTKSSTTGQTTSTSGSTGTSNTTYTGTGGISMLDPNEYSTTYYKIGNYVTFEWNYTSLSVTPSGVNVVASCSLNSHTYTISSNMSVSPTGKVVWDTKKYQANATVPLLTASYTLIIWDAAKGISATASAGHLAAASHSFAMYVPQPYTPLNGFICATCSFALSEIERLGLKFAFGMMAITIASFTWFAGDFGVFAT
ncbi:hypothetical protein BO70DRAFT_354459 [Aspergillus heteromorphus CBS 117.55]|uniref:DUF7137 domain-containing protein n=1 Tax=Aspergillus heteromorphus CBS 117.55 TaxID=1448321 RepID=A0A317VMD7_9EURO|nr:uncharacterized protein BO70DRAFT_354459 [Aspergillus heteromorphus CBS 117.55]PWY75534.1 hypothetical protein BO70DRAFT_354459 [Aspergillus heteromorphus CBS 117.55]